MELSSGNLKRDGEASLAYAYSTDHVYTPASEAIPGAHYSCPICGCAMHLTHTKTGRPIYARNAGQIHTDPICITIESKGQERSFADLDPQKFIASLCHVTPRKRKSVDPDPDGLGTDTKPNPLPTNDDDFRLSTFSSLRQIAESGVDHLTAQDKQGSHRVSDFVITYRYARELFAQPNFELGYRIVYARYMYANSTDRSILFLLFDQRNKFSVRFRLIFPSISDFKNVRDKFGKFVPDANGRTVFKRHFEIQNVLIASDNWASILKPSCKNYCNAPQDYCKTCCGMYQAIYTNTKQLYLLPADH